MPHRTRVEIEFTRQADAFSGSPTLNAPDVTRPIVTALGEHAGGRVLDLACGPGIVASALAENAREVLALDLTARTLELARVRCDEAGHANVTFARALAERVPLADASCDAVVLRLAIHHFERPTDVLTEVHRVLRPDGRLVVLDLTSPPEPEAAELHNALERLRDPSHVRALSETELSSVVGASGFEITAASAWTRTRDFDEWAAIIADPARMDALRIVMRQLARSGVRAGIELRESGNAVTLSYRFALVVARRKPDSEQPTG